MTVYVALLRAVNVGGTGKLSMTTLKSLCDEAGFAKARTYIASGNVVFESRLGEPAVKALLEARLRDCVGKPVGVLVRTHAELETVLQDNPFAGQPANRTIALFLDEAPTAEAIDGATHRTKRRSSPASARSTSSIQTEWDRRSSYCPTRSGEPLAT